MGSGGFSRALQKYVDVCADGGSVGKVYYTTAKTFDVFLNPPGLRKLARTMLDIIASRHANTPTILMYMSNAGCFVHLHVLRLLGEDARLAPDLRRYNSVCIAGTIFDSAPAYLTTTSAARALSEGIRNTTARQLAYWLYFCLITPWFLIVNSKWTFDAASAYFTELAVDPLPAPSLYIYSHHDQLTDCTRLDGLVAQRRGRHSLGEAGVRVLRIGPGEAVSPHVAHFTRHPEAYRRVLSEFIREAAGRKS